MELIYYFGPILLAVAVIILIAMVLASQGWRNQGSREPKKCPTCGKSKEQCDCHVDKNKCGSCGCE